MAFLFFVTTLGCQIKPTKVHTEPVTPLSSPTADSLSKLSPVILDTRPPFEFNIAHTPNAINVQWSDFSQSNSKFRGLLSADTYGLARRLSLIGIDPDTPVVVLGKGSEGRGEEGRVAWTLKYLGLKKVFVSHYKNFREMNPVRELPLPIKNKPYWKPKLDENLELSFKELKDMLSQEDVVFLDVRSAPEFTQRNAQSQVKKLENIEWAEFFNASGVEKNIKNKLTAKGITAVSTVVVISNHGVRSGAVTYALRELGYKNARNFSGGYEQWLF